MTTKFEENLMDTVNDFSHFVDDVADLKGVPEDAVQAALEAASGDGKTGYKFTLHFPSYMPVLQYCENRPLRELLYRAYATRASEFGKAELDNTPLISDILKLRREAATLLGYKNYAEMSLATKMADAPTDVITFLDNLAQRAKPFAQRDMQELTEYAAALGIEDMQAWDVAFVSENCVKRSMLFQIKRSNNTSLKRKF